MRRTDGYRLHIYVPEVPWAGQRARHPLSGGGVNQTDSDVISPPCRHNLFGLLIGATGSPPRVFTGEIHDRFRLALQVDRGEHPCPITNVISILSLRTNAPCVTSTKSVCGTSNLEKLGVGPGQRVRRCFRELTLSYFSGVGEEFLSLDHGDASIQSSTPVIQTMSPRE